METSTLISHVRRGFPIWNIVGRKTRKVGTIARNVRSGRSLRLTVYGSKNFRPTLSAVTNVTLEWRKRIAPIPPDYRLNSTGEALTEVSVDIDFFQRRDFHERGGLVLWNIERTQAVIFGTSVRGAPSIPNSSISWSRTTGPTVLSATSAKH
jgi:hypothetical protein